MEKLTFGDTATLASNKQYTCFANVILEGKDYAFLLDHETERVKIAEQVMKDGNLSIKIVNDEETKHKVLDIYKNHFVNDIISKVD